MFSLNLTVPLRCYLGQAAGGFFSLIVVQEVIKLDGRILQAQPGREIALESAL